MILGKFILSIPLEKEPVEIQFGQNRKSIFVCESGPVVPLLPLFSSPSAPLPPSSLNLPQTEIRFVLQFSILIQDEILWPEITWNLASSCLCLPSSYSRSPFQAPYITGALELDELAVNRGHIVPKDEENLNVSFNSTGRKKAAGTTAGA